MLNEVDPLNIPNRIKTKGTRIIIHTGRGDGKSMFTTELYRRLSEIPEGKRVNALPKIVEETFCWKEIEI